MTPADILANAIAALETAQKALKPLSECVFNDNGDMTVSGYLGYENCVGAYFAQKKIDASLRSLVSAPAECPHCKGDPANCDFDICQFRWTMNQLCQDCFAAAPADQSDTDKTPGITIMTNEQIKHLVDRFLGWRLPDNFRPDGGISYRGAGPESAQKPTLYGPTGTNLFDAVQAEAMIRYLMCAPPPYLHSTNSARRPGERKGAKRER